MIRQSVRALAVCGLALTLPSTISCDEVHQGIFHPSTDSLTDYISSFFSSTSESLIKDFGYLNDNVYDLAKGDSSLMGALGRSLIHSTINFANQFLASSPPVVRTNVSTEYPYWRCIPKYVGSAIVKASDSVQWKGNCFQENTATFSNNGNGSYTLTLQMDKPSSLLCSDSYLFGTMEGLKIETFFSKGQHNIIWTPGPNTTQPEFYDVDNRGIRIFLFSDDLISTVAELLDTALLFEPMLTLKPSAAAEARNIDFLNKYTQTYFMKPRTVQSVPVDESLIKSGDFFGIIRLDGLDPMLAWAMGSATGHTTVAIRVNGELFIAESTTNGSYWPTNGIQMTPYKTWIEQANKAGMNLLWAPLTEENRAKFNETAALEFFKTVEGLDYGYYNMLMAWVDTETQNYPCLPPDFTVCLSWPHVEILFGALDKFVPSIAQLLFGQAFNHRIGTSGLRAADIFMTANEKLKMDNLALLPTIVEDDQWDYQTKRYNDTVTGKSMVCCVFVCNMWKASGMFDSLNNEINCAELTNGDDYMMTILNGTQTRPQQCIQADPDNVLCQLEGGYTVTFLDYASRVPSKHMAERCPSEPPKYERPLNC